MNYTRLETMLSELLPINHKFISSSSIFNKFVYDNLKDINWVGFYLFDGEKLVVGPFEGNIPCTEIKIGRGVCGKAFDKNETVVVDDVRKFRGYINCDQRTKSEIVIPFRYNDELLGVWDIDSTRPHKFDLTDEVGLEKVLDRFIEMTDMSTKLLA